jgi:hypothetical protein
MPGSDACSRLHAIRRAQNQRSTQQASPALLRKRLAGQPTSLMNRVRSLLLERGIVWAEGRRSHLDALASGFGDREASGFGRGMRLLLDDMLHQSQSGLCGADLVVGGPQSQERPPLGSKITDSTASTVPHLARDYARKVALGERYPV